MTDGPKVLLVGSRLLPFRHAGDKNFWLDLLGRLPDLGAVVQVLSVTLEDVPQPAPYACRYLRPIPMYPPGDASLFNIESAGLRGTNNYTSKTVTFPRMLAALRELDRSFRPDVIHFIDNYGPVMLTLRPFTRGRPLAISAPTYHRRSRLYDVMLKASFRSFDRVVPLTRAYAARLRTLGLDPSKVECIPWGVDLRRFRRATPEERASARVQLGLGEADLVVVWTGFTQQTTTRDLDFARRVARKVLDADARGVAFEFCFKPEHFDPRFQEIEGGGIRVRGSAGDFGAARLAADVLLSPFLTKDATVGPPLTWLEFMAMEIPVLSTPAPGVEEAVIHGETGLLASTVEEAFEAIQGLRSDPGRLARLRVGARRLVSERFTVERSAKDYVALWTRVAQERPRPRSRAGGRSLGR